jgi:hypothetical protein
LGTGTTLFGGTVRRSEFSLRDLQRFGATTLITLERDSSTPRPRAEHE